MEEMESANEMLPETEEELSCNRAEDDFKVPVAYAWKEAEDDDLGTEPVHAD